MREPRCGRRTECRLQDPDLSILEDPLSTAHIVDVFLEVAPDL